MYIVGVHNCGEEGNRIQRGRREDLFNGQSGIRSSMVFF